MILISSIMERIFYGIWKQFVYANIWTIRNILDTKSVCYNFQYNPLYYKINTNPVVHWDAISLVISQQTNVQIPTGILLLLYVFSVSVRESTKQKEEFTIEELCIWLYLEIE